MATIKGILSFPTLFIPKVAKGADLPKYSCSILLPPTDPQIPALQAEVEAAKLNSFPSGYTGQDECLTAYDIKYAGKDYYDPRFTGWWALSCTAKVEDKPAVVDMSHQPILDPGAVYSGMVGYVHLGISGYTKGKGGIGGWLNGVMVTAEEPPMGRLDGKPSVEQMFANVGAPVQPQLGVHNVPAPAAVPPVATPPPAVVAPPTPPVPPAAPPVAAGHVMTAKAAGQTYEASIALGWTDENLIAHGMMLPPGGVQPSFIAQT